MHMDTVADGLNGKICIEAAARYARSSSSPAQVHLSSTPPPPALPLRTSPSHSEPRLLREPPPRPQPPATRHLITPVREPLPPAVRELPPPPVIREHPLPREIITLDQVRSGPRPQNDYVDSPHLAALRTLQQHKSTQPNHSNVGVNKSATLGTDRTVGYHPSYGGNGGAQHNDLIISTQPQTLKKDRSNQAVGDHASSAPCQDSIICSQCGKCRCQACTQPRELPRRWLCNNKCECSLQKMVDVCSCLCCVRACFYHCFKDSEGDECSASDEPCACCERPHCCKRWTGLGIMSLCLPCLCLYWPLRCGLSCCTSVYNQCSHRGCHCRRDKDKLPSSKRLLIDSESSST